MTDEQKQKFKDLEAQDRKNRKTQVVKKSKPKYTGPKRPTSAFFFFQEERRPQLKEKNPDKSHKEIVSVSTLTLDAWIGVERTRQEQGQVHEDG